MSTLVVETLHKWNVPESFFYDDSQRILDESQVFRFLWRYHIDLGDWSDITTEQAGVLQYDPVVFYYKCGLTEWQRKSYQERYDAL